MTFHDPAFGRHDKAFLLIVDQGLRETDLLGACPTNKLRDSYSRPQ